MTLFKIKGFSLIEVLISLLLISLILFGLNATQIYSIREAKIACFFNTAMNQIDNATERLSALNRYDGLDEQLAIWNAENKTVLPSGFGTISGFFPDYVVTIYWGGAPNMCAKQKIGSSGCLRKKIQLA